MPDAVINALGTIAAAFVGVVTWYLASRHDRQREATEREAAMQAAAPSAAPDAGGEAAADAVPPVREKE